MLKNFGSVRSNEPVRNSQTSRSSNKRSTLLSTTDSIFSNLTKTTAATEYSETSSTFSRNPRATPNIFKDQRNMSLHSSDSVRSAPLRHQASISSHDGLSYITPSTDPTTPQRTTQPPLTRSNTANTMGSLNGMPLSPPHTPIPGDGGQVPFYPPSKAEKLASLEAMNQNETSIHVVYASDATHNFEKGMLSKTKKEYIVLTNQHLIRFKNQNKANQSLDLFSSNSSRTTSIPSSSKVFSSKDHFMFRLDSIIASQATGAAPYSFRIDYMVDAGARQPSSVTLTVESANERAKWLDRLRSLTRVYLPRSNFMPREEKLRVAERLIKHREVADDGDETVTHKVVYKERRLKNDNSGLYKDVFTLINIAIGQFSLYLLPSITTDDDHIKQVGRDRYGLLSIQSINLDTTDDSLKITFLQTQGDPKKIEIASCHSEILVQDTRRAIYSLVPLYTTPPYQLVAPETVRNTRMIPTYDTTRSENLGFDRLIEAYCAAFNLNKKRIVYSIESSSDAEEGLSVSLLPVNEVNDSPDFYSKFELLAFFRALRHNTTFRAISFNGIKLSELQSWTIKGAVGWMTTMDDGIQLDNVLASEIYSLIISNKKLRRLDLSSCSIEGTDSEQSSISMIGRVLKTQKTGLNSILLDNNRLSETDVRSLAAGIQVARKAIRELALRNCSLEGTHIEIILQSLYTRSPGHLKYLDISQNCKNISSTQVDGILRRCKHIEHLFLRETGYIPEIQNLAISRLKTLDLGMNPLTDELILVLCQWIGTPSFLTIQTLYLDGCNLHAGHVRDLLIAITRTGNQTLHLDLGANPVFKEVSHLPRLWYAIMKGYTPSSLSLKGIEWEENSLQEFLDAILDNQQLSKLDISAMNLIPRQGNVVGSDTIKKLGCLLERNKVLEELNLSGGVDENGGRIGLGKALSPALSSLNANTTLKRLILYGIRFGDVGISAIAEMLKTNRSIMYLDIDDNSVTIDGYRILNEALVENTSLIYMPRPRIDVRNQLKYLNETITELTLAENESRFFIANSAGADSRRAKASLQLQLQVRKSAETARAKIGSEVDKIMLAVERNKDLWDRVQAQYRQATQNITGRNNYIEESQIDDMYPSGATVSSALSDRTPPFEYPIAVGDWAAATAGHSYPSPGGRTRSNSATLSEHSSVGSHFVAYTNKPDAI